MSELDYESDEGGGGFGFGDKASDDEFETSWDGGKDGSDAGSVVELEESIEEIDEVRVSRVHCCARAAPSRLRQRPARCRCGLPR
jgi:hypothetical protein